MILKTTNNSHIAASSEMGSGNMDKVKALDAAKKFESLMASLMIKSMTQNSSEMFGGESSFGGDNYDMIFVNELANAMTKGKGIGVADKIYKKLTGETLQHLPAPSISKPINTKPIPSGTISPGNSSINRLNKYDELINEASERFGVDKNIIKSVILAESAAKENALSTANAKGLMQLIDSTAKDMGVQNVWDPKQNILGGTKYLAELLRQYNGDIKLALAGYNAGPGNVQKYNGIPPFNETRNYITRVTGYINHFRGL